ncbi:MAG TPA: hypothetical protein PL117_15315, partial [Accumulibacter sp.]|uniref:hypothetical protein n=1 Tax=Accumulibacter sp. TaxID=2053492 RepID=UPI002CC19E0D
MTIHFSLAIGPGLAAQPGDKFHGDEIIGDHHLRCARPLQDVVIQPGVTLNHQIIEFGGLRRQIVQFLDNDHLIAGSSHAAGNQPPQRTEADDDNVVCQTVEDAFHGSVLTRRQSGIARKQAGKLRDCVAA